MNHKTEIATYYFPNYHIDTFNQKVHHDIWTEWELVKNAIPRFKGHQQPKVPLWGYEDESIPEVMEKKIRCAKDYGIDCFIFDYYHYNEGKFLNRCLDEGFLKAKNTKDIKFSLMWANHTWTDIHPAKLDKDPDIIFSGKIEKEVFYKATQEMIEKYFVLDNYWRIEGKPYVSFYEINQLASCFNSFDELSVAIEDFRERARIVVGEIHINIIAGEIALLPKEMISNDSYEIINKLKIDSVTSYTWVHHNRLEGFPTMEYDELKRRHLKDLPKIASLYNKPYFPNLSMGWDSSPRTIHSQDFIQKNYPYTPIIVGNTPEKFKEALLEVIEFARSRNYNYSYITINAWNEWTEGSYLEPDTSNGFKYLEAIKEYKNNL